MARSTTYWNYIKTEELLGLQTGVDKNDVELSNDEVMFIVVHQIDELWFKLILRELAAVRDLFAQERVREQSLSAVVRGLRRTALLFNQIATHFQLMETMTTRDYLSFRDKLSPASGFQSAQLREIEILIGLDASKRVPLGHESSYMEALKHADGSKSAAFHRVSRRLGDLPTLYDALGDWLFRTPIQGSTPEAETDPQHVDEFIESYIEAHSTEVAKVKRRACELAKTDKDRERLTKRYDREVLNARAFLRALDRPEEHRPRSSRIRASLVFIESYRELPLLAWPREVLDAVVELEQSFLIFRQRHARMVERVIGRRTGTGGSAGVDYLDQTALRYRIFHDLWTVRTLLIRKDALPPLLGPEVYGFVANQ